MSASTNTSSRGVPKTVQGSKMSLNLDGKHTPPGGVGMVNSLRNSLSRKQQTVTNDLNWRIGTTRPSDNYQTTTRGIETASIGRPCKRIYAGVASPTYIDRRIPFSFFSNCDEFIVAYPGTRGCCMSNLRSHLAWVSWLMRNRKQPLIRKIGLSCPRL
jgi:hypothetical protein